MGTTIMAVSLLLERPCPSDAAAVVAVFSAAVIGEADRVVVVGLCVMSGEELASVVIVVGTTEGTL